MPAKIARTGASRFAGARLICFAALLAMASLAEAQFVFVPAAGPESPQPVVVYPGRAATPATRPSGETDYPRKPKSGPYVIPQPLPDAVSTSSDPSSITMHLQSAPLAAVLKDFAIQSNADVVLRGQPAIDAAKPGASLVTIDIDHASFWDALRAINKFAKLPVSIHGTQLWLGGAEEPEAALKSLDGFANGPFLIHPLRAEFSRTYNFQTKPSRGWTYIECDFIPEPRFADPDFIECREMIFTDDKGHEARSRSATGAQVNEASGEVSRQQDARPNPSIRNWRSAFLEYPNMSTHVALVSGYFETTIQPYSSTMEFKDFANGKMFNLGGNNTLNIQVQPQPIGQPMLSIRLTLDNAPGTTALTRAQHPLAGLHFYTAGGDELLPESQPPENHGGTTATAIWTWQIPFREMPALIRLELSGPSMHLDVPIKMTDLTVPAQKS